MILPKKDGFTVLEEIRSSDVLKDLPVIIASNLGQKEDIDRGMELGSNDYVVKTDLTLDDLIKKIHTIVPAE